jgi:putative membrane protein
MKGRFSKNYPFFCLFAYLIFWGFLAIKPLNRFDWFLENLLPFIFVPAIIFTFKKFRFSNASYTLITVFMMLHAIGAHYTYEKVPFTRSLFNIFHFERDNYDRLVHFSFGFLMVYPIRELEIRLSGVRGIFTYFIPINTIISGSAIYEIIECAVASIVQPENAIAWLGIQGDVFDAEKDMLMAAIGAVITMTASFLKNRIIQGKNVSN